MSVFERMAPVRHDTIDGIPEPSEHTLLVGHADAAEALAAAYASGRMHHAFLVVGPAGIGKATLAYRLAYHLLAHPDPARAPASLELPDAASPLFRQIAQDAHPAVLHLTRPVNDRTKGFKSVITVDEVRRLGRFLSMTSHDGGWRIVIVDPADDLNNSAANALLKSLEEPPGRTLFVLIAHSPGRLLPTIRSRCQIVRLSPLADAEVLAALAGVGASLPPGEGARTELARRAEGSVRGAIMLTEYGGLEIGAAIDEVLAAGAFDVGAAARVADAVTGREQGQQFALFNMHLSRSLSDAAAAAAQTGEAARSERLATHWDEFRRMSIETDTYNLDKRQHVIGSLMRAHAELARG